MQLKKFEFHSQQIYSDNFSQFSQLDHNRSERMNSFKINIISFDDFMEKIAIKKKEEDKKKENENNKSLNFSNISPINKENQSEFPFDRIEKIRAKIFEIEYQSFHFILKNNGDYETAKKYIKEGKRVKGLYNYFFTFLDSQGMIHFQVQKPRTRRMFYSCLPDCTFYAVIRDYSFIDLLIETEKLEEIEIKKKIGNLNLGPGCVMKNRYLTKIKLEEYCRKKGKTLFVD